MAAVCQETFIGFCGTASRPMVVARHGGLVRQGRAVYCGGYFFPHGLWIALPRRNSFLADKITTDLICHVWTAQLFFPGPMWATVSAGRGKGPLYYPGRWPSRVKPLWRGRQRTTHLYIAKYGMNPFTVRPEPKAMSIGGTSGVCATPK